MLTDLPDTAPAPDEPLRREWDQDPPAAVLKIGERAHMEALLRGMVYLNTARYFRDQCS
jgi:hypothetical protein